MLNRFFILTVITLSLCYSSYGQRVNYTAKKAVIAPVIDGIPNDACWNNSGWGAIDQEWFDKSMPDSTDFYGRYKAVWTPDKLFLLVEITDDLLLDDILDPLESYWEDDCLEIFIDEDNSGGDHKCCDQAYNAFAYHISPVTGDVVDLSSAGEFVPRLYNNHLEIKVKSTGTLHVMELAIKIYDDTFNDEQEINAPVQLNEGKTMGFSIAYCDHDGSGRENFIGTQSGGLDSWMNADLFGSLQLTNNINNNYKATWIANTYGKGGQPTSANHPWVQNYIDCMYVTEDGTCYTTSIWDEGGRKYGIYKDGNVLGNKNYNINCGQAGGFSITGDLITGNGLTISDAGNPTALAIGRGPYEGKLIVADNGPGKRVLIYDVTGNAPHIEEIIGAEGGTGADYTANYDFPQGIHSKPFPAGHYPPGIYHPLKFWTLTGVGMDNQGRLFVSTSELASSIRCFKKDSKNNWILDWKLENYSFVDNGDFDRTTGGTDIYTVQERFSMDYSQEAQGAEWSIKSVTVDEAKYPKDPRALLRIKAGHEHGLTSAIIRYIDGERFLFANGMTCQWTWIFRFIEGTDVAVPSACISSRHRIYDIKPDEFWPPNIPTDGRQYIWRDVNGDVNYQTEEYTATSFGHTQAWHIDQAGGIWGAKGNVIHRYNPSGLDEAGNPIYSDENSETYTISGMNPIGKISWQPEYDRLVLLDKGCRDLKGGRVYLVDNFSTGNRQAIFLTELKGDNPSSIDVAGKYLFEVGWETRGKCWITDLSTGETVATLEPYGDAGTTEYTGWVDIGFGITAYERPNGEYVVQVEEDGWGKILLYRWCPSGECAENCTSMADSIIVEPDTLYLNGFQNAILKATVFPDTVCNKKVVWSSGDINIAKINYQGELTSTGEGSTWIKAVSSQQNNIVDSCLVSVTNVDAEHIEFQFDSLQLPLNRFTQLEVHFIPTNTLNRQLSWKSTIDSIVSVDQNGTIKALREGNAPIIALSENSGLSDTCFIEVIPVPVEKIEFSKKKIPLWEESKVQVQASIFPEDAANKKIIWTIADTTIAVVNTNGMVLGKSAGETILLATSEQSMVKDSCILVVLSEHEFASSGIGTVCAEGSLEIKEDTAYLVSGSGNDIWNASDEFHFVYKPGAGSQAIIARIASMENTNEWAKAGVMMRETDDPGSKHVMMVLTPGNGSSFQRRTVTGGPSDHSTPNDHLTAPYWVKLIRDGNTFSGYNSVNGRNWTKVNEISFNMTDSIYIGLSVTSHNACVLNTTLFEHVVITSNIDTVLPFPSNDATLSDLKVNGFTIDGFYESSLMYTIEYLSDTIDIPTVEAETTDPNATAVITQTLTLPGRSTILVTAEDGFSTLNYVIDFTLSTTVMESCNKNLQIFPNPAGNYIRIIFPSASEIPESISIYDIIGKLLLTSKCIALSGDQSLLIDISSLEKGIYLLEAGDKPGNIFKFMVQYN